MYVFFLSLSALLLLFVTAFFSLRYSEIVVRFQRLRVSHGKFNSAPFCSRKNEFIQISGDLNESENRKICITHKTMAKQQLHLLGLCAVYIHCCRWYNWLLFLCIWDRFHGDTFLRIAPKNPSCVFGCVSFSLYYLDKQKGQKLLHNLYFLHFIPVVFCCRSLFDVLRTALRRWRRLFFWKLNRIEWVMSLSQLYRPICVFECM